MCAAELALDGPVRASVCHGHVTPCFLMQGREQEVTLSDLHHIAEEEQKAWFDAAGSRQVGVCSVLRHSACITAHVLSCVLHCVQVDVNASKENP